MKIEYTENKDIPALAWFLKIEKSTGIAKLEHGRSVECASDFFVSGVWDGDFSNGDFAHANFSCCTGGKLVDSDACGNKGGGIMISTPNHFQESLFSVKSEGCLSFSNSLAFLLERLGCDLDENFFRYEESLCRGLFGFRAGDSEIPLKGGVTLRLFQCCNVKIGEDLEESREKKESGLTFASYREYREKVARVLRSIKKNATDAARKSAFGMITTLSRGYDAVAASVLAKEVGCEEAFSFNRPANYRDDCGSEIGEFLGFKKIHECDADFYKNNQDLLEAEACASGEVGAAIVFSGYEKLFRRKLLFLGVRGDSVWERLHGNVNDGYDFSRGNTLSDANSSFCENFLKNETVAIHVPLIGADRWSEIARISNSDEMKSFSVRENYDRPIARRIAEEAGIGREDFGREKSGAGISYHFDVISSMRRKMSAESYSKLKTYARELRRNRFKYLIYCSRFFISNFPAYVNWFASRMRLPIRLNAEKTGKMSSPASSTLILWGVHEMRKRYRKAC